MSKVTLRSKVIVDAFNVGKGAHTPVAINGLEGKEIGRRKEDIAEDGCRWFKTTKGYTITGSEVTTHELGQFIETLDALQQVERHNLADGSGAYSDEAWKRARDRFWGPENREPLTIAISAKNIQSEA